MPAEVIMARWRRPAFAVVISALLAFTALAIAVHGEVRPSAIDLRAARWADDTIGTTGARLLLDLTEPALTTAGTIGVIVAALVLGRRRFAVLAVAAPVSTLLLGEIVLKPLVGRHVDYGMTTRTAVISHGYAYPSGHEIGLAVLTSLAALAVAHLVRRRRTRVLSWAGLALWTVLGAVGLTRNLFHYATDTVGSVLLSVAMVLGLGLAIDVLAGRRGDRRPQLT